MTFEAFKVEFDAKLARMSLEEVKAALEAAGCEFEQEPEGVRSSPEAWEEWTTWPPQGAFNSSELALAA